MYSKAQVGAVIDLLEQADTEGARQAFMFLITAFEGVPKVEPEPGEHGFIRDFRFLVGGKNYFAFTANSGWLLWYFRRPALSSGSVTEQQILKAFPDAEETSSREFKLKISTYDEAVRVFSFVSKALCTAPT